jgi:stress response protein YsnF
VLKEEVRVRKRTVETPRQESVVLREEEAFIERSGSASK